MYDFLIIGSGPGGYIAAIRAAQLGLTVAIIDKNQRPGGTCLNVGCIPSKSLLDASYKYWQTKHHFSDIGIQVDNVHLNLDTMMRHKNKIIDELARGIHHLFKKNSIDFYQGTAIFTSFNQVDVVNDAKETTSLHAKNILIATGSSPHTLSNLSIDEKYIVSSTGVLSLDHVPRHLVVVGGGYIGLEMGSVWQRLGARVTVIEYSDMILTHVDNDVRVILQRSLEKQGMTFKCGSRISGTPQYLPDDTLSFSLVSSKDDTLILDEMICDRILVATGRKPMTNALGLERLGIQRTSRDSISVNKHYQTSLPNIFAIGDCIEGPMLAHKAMEEGVAVAEFLAGYSTTVNYDVIPAVVFTHPEIATVGKNENDLNGLGIEYKIGKFPFSANGRAKTLRDTDGFVKILTHKATDRVLGCAIIGPEAGSLIGQVATLMEFGGSAEDIARTCHAHPTLNETIKEAAWSAFDRPLHS